MKKGAKEASTADEFCGPTLSADHGQWKQFKLHKPWIMAAGNCSSQNGGREVDLVWMNGGSRTRVEAIRGIERRWSADINYRRAWSGIRGREVEFLCGQTADHGRCQDHLTHFSIGSNPGLSGRPVSSFKLL